MISSWYKPDIGQRLGEVGAGRGELQGGGVQRGPTAAGEQVMVVRTPVEGTDFTFVELIPLSQLVGPVRALRFYAILLLGAIVLLIALADLLFTRWMTSPILALKGTMDRFSRGSWRPHPDRPGGRTGAAGPPPLTTWPSAPSP